MTSQHAQVRYSKKPRPPSPNVFPLYISFISRGWRGGGWLKEIYCRKTKNKDVQQFKLELAGRLPLPHRLACGILLIIVQATVKAKLNADPCHVCHRSPSTNFPSIAAGRDPTHAVWCANIHLSWNHCMQPLHCIMCPEHRISTLPCRTARIHAQLHEWCSLSHTKPRNSHKTRSTCCYERTQHVAATCIEKEAVWRARCLA